MAGSYTDLAGAMPLATTFAFRRWYFDLLGKRLETALRSRATTYYFDATSGDDAAGAGTQASPWRTLSKAQAVLDGWTVSEAGLALLFRRGGEFVSQTGLAVTKGWVTVGAYGSGERPLWSRFTAKFAAGGGGWVQVGGTHYKRGGLGGTVAWVRRQDKRLSPPTRMTSAAEVTGQTSSWWYDAVGQELHVNFGTDANGLNLEAAYANDNSGVWLTGDGTVARDIRFDGWGLNPSNTGNQQHGVIVGTNGLLETAVIGCESYYNSSHAMAFNGGGAPSCSGGVSTFVDCTAGLCIPNASGETVFNSYVHQGGQETIFHHCRAAFGRLPTSTTTRGGRAMYGHTSGPAVKLLIGWGTRVDDGAWGCTEPGNWVNLPTAERLEDVRGVMVDEDAVIGSLGSGALLGAGMARINPRWRIVAGQSVAGTMDPHEASGWVINGQVTVDMKDVTDRYSIYNGPGTNNNRGRIFHSHLHVVGNGSSGFGIDYDTWFGAVSSSPGAQMINSILGGENLGTGQLMVGLNNDGQRMHHNAYYAVTDQSDMRGYGNDGARVVLTDVVTVGAAPWPAHALQGTGSAELRVEFDANWRPRDMERPSIGPVEETAARGDVGALWSHLDGRIEEISGRVVEGLMAREIDGMSYESALEAMLAVMAGVAARSGGVVTFYRRDGQTAKVRVGMGEGDGERVESLIY